MLNMEFIFFLSYILEMHAPFFSSPKKVGDLSYSLFSLYINPALFIPTIQHALSPQNNIPYPHNTAYFIPTIQHTLSPQYNIPYPHNTTYFIPTIQHTLFPQYMLHRNPIIHDVSNKYFILLGL